MNKPTIQNYSQAAYFLHRKSDNRSAGCGNTRIVRLGVDTIAVRLHETNVVTYHADGRIVLRAGGWKTVTTKARINAFAPVTVRSRKGEWYANGSAFYEGMNVG